MTKNNELITFSSKDASFALLFFYNKPTRRVLQKLSVSKIVGRFGAMENTLIHLLDT